MGGARGESLKLRRWGVDLSKNSLGKLCAPVISIRVNKYFTKPMSTAHGWQKIGKRQGKADPRKAEEADERRLGREVHPRGEGGGVLGATVAATPREGGFN